MEFPILFPKNPIFLIAVLSSSSVLYGCNTPATFHDGLASASRPKRNAETASKALSPLSLPASQLAATDPGKLAKTTATSPTAPTAHGPRKSRLPAVTLVSKKELVSLKNSLTPNHKESTMQYAEPTTRSTGKVEHVTTGDFQEMVLDSDIPVLVDFYADWCGPCRRLSPVLDELARDMPHAQVVKVNVDDSPELAGQYRISSIPAVMVFKDGAVVAQHAGLADKSALERMLRE
jgi:thioredoxin 1